MKRFVAAVVLIAMLTVMVGCSAHIHVIGKGAQQGQKMQARQWYVLFGLVPINNVETSAMVGGAQDYTIKTEQSALDVIINIFTSWISVYSRTVTVSK